MKAAADAEAIAKADEIYKRSIEKPDSGEPAVGEQVGEKRQLPEAARHQPRRGVNVKSSKKNK